MQKYPFMLYAGGDREGDYRIAEDEDQEAALRAEGFKGLADDAEDSAPAPKATKASKAKDA